MPNKAWPGIVFSHWGRLELNHTSNTDYGPDDYSKPFVHADMDTDWREAFDKHPCFDPKKVCQRCSEAHSVSEALLLHIWRRRLSLRCEWNHGDVGRHIS